MAKLLLLFSWPNDQVEATVPRPTPIRNLKEMILNEVWPDSQIMQTKVHSIRLFSMGKELHNELLISEINVPEPDFRIPIIVQVISIDQANNMKINKESCCSSCEVW
jgi:hypothetical protein